MHRNPGLIVRKSKEKASLSKETHWPPERAVKKTSPSNDWFSQKQTCLLSLSQTLTTFCNTTKKSNIQQTTWKPSSHNSFPPITIITRFYPQITYSSRINHRQSQVLQGPLSQTTSYNLTESHITIKAKQCEKHQSGLQTDSTDQQTDKMWCTGRQTWAGTSGSVTDTFIGLVNNMASDPGQQCWNLAWDPVVLQSQTRDCSVLGGSSKYWRSNVTRPETDVHCTHHTLS